MKHTVTTVAVALAAILLSSVPATSVVFAQEATAEAAAMKEKSAPEHWQVMHMKKQFEAVSFTDDQTTTYQETLKKLSGELTTLEKEGLTKEMVEGRAKKMKTGRSDGLSFKEARASANEGFEKSELKLFRKYDNAVKMFEKSVSMTLTVEQLDQLPKQAKKRLTNARERAQAGEGSGAKGSGKKGKGKKGSGKKANGDTEAAETDDVQ